MVLIGLANLYALRRRLVTAWTNRIASAVCKSPTVTPKTPVKSALQTGQSDGGSQKTPLRHPEPPKCR